MRRARWLLLLLAACHLGPCAPKAAPPEVYEPLRRVPLRHIVEATTLPTDSHWQPEHGRIQLFALPSAGYDGGADGGLPRDAGFLDLDELTVTSDSVDDPDAGPRCPRGPGLVCSADCWCHDSTQLTTTDLVSVFTAGNETWVVGPMVLHRVGEAWINTSLGLAPTAEPGTFVPTAPGPIRAAGAVFGADGEIWFSVGARIRHLVGDRWDTSNVLGSHPNELTSLWGASARSVWAVGRGGAALHFDGAAWYESDVGSTEWLTGVAGYRNDETWIVGTSGTVLRQVGSSWNRVPAGAASQEWFTGVQVPSPGVAWLSTNNGHIYRATPRGLEQAVDSPGPIFGLWFASASEGWAVGYAGLLLHYDGKTWKQVASGAATDLLAIHGDDTRIWASGRNGTLLFHQR